MMKLLIIIPLILSTSLALATPNVVLSESRRVGENTQEFLIPVSAKKSIYINIISNEFPTNPLLTIQITIESSIDGGVTWKHVQSITSSGGNFGGGPSGKSDGLCRMRINSDGEPALFRVKTISPIPFRYGVTYEII